MTPYFKNIIESYRSPLSSCHAMARILKTICVPPVFGVPSAVAANRGRLVQEDRRRPKRRLGLQVDQGETAGVEMVIGWICSRDHFKTSWEGLHEVLPIVIAKESKLFSCVLSLPLSGVVIVTLNRSYRIRTYTPDAGDHGELFWSGFG